MIKQIAINRYNIPETKKLEQIVHHFVKFFFSFSSSIEINSQCILQCYLITFCSINYWNCSLDLESFTLDFDIKFNFLQEFLFWILITNKMCMSLVHCSEDYLVLTISLLAHSCFIDVTLSYAYRSILLKQSLTSVRSHLDCWLVPRYHFTHELEWKWNKYMFL